MALPSGTLSRLSRRELLKQLAATPLLLRPAPFVGSSLLSSGQPSPAALSFADVHYTPHYPARSPLDDVLRLVAPGSDSYVTEKYASEIEALLARWGQALQNGDLESLKASLSPDIQACSLTPARKTTLRNGFGIESVRHDFAPQLQTGADTLLRELGSWTGPAHRVLSSEFQVTAIQEAGIAPLSAHSAIRFSLVLQTGVAERQQRVGVWQMDWSCRTSQDDAATWQATRLLAQTETQSTVKGAGFVDVTALALGGVPSFAAQMLVGADEWRTVLDGACGIDVYGNNGVAAGDYDNDGFDDIYVCQTAGLPNRLYRNRRDGTFEDVTEKAGVGVLDNTACALFADFRNIGRQDLLVVCNSGPLLFQNQGDGTFSLKRDAFVFARPPQGTFTHAAIADYDGDGRLDIYFCLYSYYLGLDQYHYPAPYFDARNGPPNFLMHNQGDGTFTDRTEAAGLHMANDRYSFSCAWGNAGSTLLPDLYVVNDFGRNNFYRSNGDGTFRAESAKTHVEDVGAGMSACWADYNNDGHPDLYVANMWSAAGQRISQQDQFHANTPQDLRGLYRQHAGGNALYRNRGDSTFANVSQQAGAEMGRWAWCSDFIDIDHDGYPDLYISNGYITAPEPRSNPKRTGPTTNNSGKSGNLASTDLASFFWRQVVAKSPDDATPSLAYERGWNALNELIRSDHSWSGHERNVLLANNRDGSFSEVSGALAIDFLEDSRSFALADLDGDGRLEIVLKNRNAPQLKILRNAMEHLGNSITFRLRGTKSNRDAIGTAITVQAGDLHQTKYLQAGSGFLAQHSKDLFFGIGQTPADIRATVRWPGGITQQFDHLPSNSQIHLEEGKPTFTATPFTKPAAIYTGLQQTQPSLRPASLPRKTWLLDPVKAPGFSLQNSQGSTYTLAENRGRNLLLHFWSIYSADCMDQLHAFEHSRAALANAQLDVLLIHLDTAHDRDQAQVAIQKERFSLPVLFATEDVGGIYNIVIRYLFDRRNDLEPPATLLLDSHNMIVKVYQGAVQVEELIQDAESIPVSSEDRTTRGLPFPGEIYSGKFSRNDFTYGIAMFQHGYFHQAEESFRQVIAKRPDDAEAHYNLGTLTLRAKQYSDARQYLQQALKLKPDYPEAWNNLGMIAAQEGQATQAVQNFERSLTLRPNYPTALLNLGNLYRRQQDFPKAQDLLSQAVRLQPDDPEVNYSLGMFYAQQNKTGPAIQYLEKALSLRHDYPEALNNLGVILVRQQDYMKAEQQFQICIRLVPDFDESYLNLARLYVLQQQNGKARQALEDLLRRKPDSTVARQGLQMLSSTP